jgi:DNA invertase Pin-like site-specific DNA recombinase
MPSCHGYARVSDKQQVEGDSLDAQDDRLSHWYETHPVGDDRKPLREQGVQWGAVYRDEGESAFKKRFLQRPNAARLFHEAKEGDHVVIDRMDRAFRNIGDTFNVIEAFQRKGVSVHLRDHPEIDFSTAMGRMIAGMLAIMAEWFSAILSERMKEVAARRKANGKPVNQKRPFAKKLKGRGKYRRFVDNPSDLVIAARVKKMREDDRLSFAKIADALEREHCEKLGLPYEKPSAWKKPKSGWTCSRVRKMYGEFTKHLEQREGEDAA